MINKGAEYVFDCARDVYENIALFEYIFNIPYNVKTAIAERLIEMFYYGGNACVDGEILKTLLKESKNIEYANFTYDKGIENFLSDIYYDFKHR